jgi:hypothetical protein
MTPEQTAVAWAVNLALVATAAALIVRSRWRLCWAFAVYVAVVMLYSLGILLWPHRFYNQWFGMAGHAVFDAVRMWIALEIAWRVLRNVANRRGTLLVLGGIAVFTTAVRMEGIGSGLVRSDAWRPWIDNGALLVMVATLLIARRHRLTLHPFHAALLTSFAAYQAVFGLLISIYAYDMPAEHLVWKLRQYDPFAYLALACSWAYVAWRRAPHTISSSPGAMTAGEGEGNAQSGQTRESWRMFQRRGFWSASRSSTEA